MTAVTTRVLRQPRSSARLPLRAVALAFATVALSACGDSDTPQSPTQTTQKIVEVFAGRLSPGGSGFYSFQVRTSDTASYTLASLTQVASGRAVEATLTLGVGVPAGEDCNVSSSTQAAPALAPQLSTNVSPGIHCVSLADPGALTEAANFAVRIQHP